MIRIGDEWVRAEDIRRVRITPSFSGNQVVVILENEYQLVLAPGERLAEERALELVRTIEDEMRA